MPEDKNSIAARLIHTVTNYSLGVNAGLFLLKIVVGLQSGSMALVADAIHSLSDAATDFVVYLGHYFGSKAPDKRHPYGHGRIETFSAGLIALILIGVGCGMIYHAAIDIAKGGNKATPGVAVLGVACVSIVLKEVLFRVTVRAAKQSHSSALYANAWHHRSDAFSSIAVFIGVAALRYGYRFGDQIAAMSVGLMVMLVGAKVIGTCLSELAEGAVDHETEELITGVIDANPSIRQWHKLRTRSVGREIFLDLHILVDPELNVHAAHDITESVEAGLEEQLTCPVNITIHIEPDLPELRHEV
jgi:cation diffusion facilitator family transporter